MSASMSVPADNQRRFGRSGAQRPQRIGSEHALHEMLEDAQKPEVAGVTSSQPTRGTCHGEDIKRLTSDVKQYRALKGHCQEGISEGFLR